MINECFILRSANCPQRGKDLQAGESVVVRHTMRNSHVTTPHTRTKLRQEAEDAAQKRRQNRRKNEETETCAIVFRLYECPMSQRKEGIPLVQDSQIRRFLDEKPKNCRTLPRTRELRSWVSRVMRSECPARWTVRPLTMVGPMDANEFQGVFFQRFGCILGKNEIGVVKRS